MSFSRGCWLLTNVIILEVIIASSLGVLAPLPCGSGITFEAVNQCCNVLFCSVIGIFPYEFFGVGGCPRITSTATDERLPVFFRFSRNLSGRVSRMKQFVGYDYCFAVDRFQGIPVPRRCDVQLILRALAFFSVWLMLPCLQAGSLIASCACF